MHKVPAYFLNTNSGGKSQMPRPKSNLTGNTKNIGVRLTKAHYEEWKLLGGAQWLRKELTKKLQEKADDARSKS